MTQAGVGRRVRVLVALPHPGGALPDLGTRRCSARAVSAMRHQREGVDHGADRRDGRRRAQGQLGAVPAQPVDLRRGRGRRRPAATRSAHARVPCHTSGASDQMSPAPASASASPSSACRSAAGRVAPPQLQGREQHQQRDPLARAGRRPGEQLDGLEVGGRLVEPTASQGDPAAREPDVERRGTRRPQLPRLRDRALGLVPPAQPEQRVGGVGQQRDPAGTRQPQRTHALDAVARVRDALDEPVQRAGEELGAAQVRLAEGLRFTRPLRDSQGLVDRRGARPRRRRGRPS